MGVQPEVGVRAPEKEWVPDEETERERGREKDAMNINIPLYSETLEKEDARILLFPSVI